VGVHNLSGEKLAGAQAELAQHGFIYTVAGLRDIRATASAYAVTRRRVTAGFNAHRIAGKPDMLDSIMALLPAGEILTDKRAKELKAQLAPPRRRASSRPRPHTRSQPPTTNTTSSEAPMAATRPVLRRRINETPEAEAAALRILDDNQTYDDVEAATGLSNTVLRAAVAREEGRREERANPQIDPATLSQTAQDRLESALRQQTRRLEVEFAQRRAQIDEEVRLRVVAEGTAYRERMQAREQDAQRLETRYRRLIDNHRLPFTPAEFAAIQRCLHPDSANADGERTVSRARLQTAFNLLRGKKLQLTGEE
jgi:hypothetical protein